MSEVKRYDLVGDMDGNCNLNEARMELSDDGVYVKHNDYAALEAKCTALAAENSGLKSGAIKAIEDIQCFYDSEAWHVSEDGESETAVVALDDAKGSVEHFVLNVKTPATYASLAEIERKAIRKFINSIEHILRDKLSPYDTEEVLEAMRIFLEEQGGEQK